MSMSLNRVQLIGNLTADPEMKQIPSGQMVTTFSLATNRTWTDDSGQKQSKVEFHNLVAWGKLAEICGQYLKKGGKAFVEGRLQTRDWEGQDGVKRYRTEVVLENMIMLDRKGESMGGGDMAAGAMAGGAAGVAAQQGDDGGFKPADGGQGEEEVSIDDLPF
ncbi:single-stranded DNA-binding protein [Candidatus Peregrinibacteria bacterium HGW-Peregrinibacteria-1]|jgi:single-strand DNA-binding protein|nr:MAG: single-stranded DNA-binding protein [Candidatus Peregrinibacteria bacterium HGW-Peregrinibacteria-1]